MNENTQKRERKRAREGECLVLLSGQSQREELAWGVTLKMNELSVSTEDPHPTATM